MTVFMGLVFAVLAAINFAFALGARAAIDRGFAVTFGLIAVVMSFAMFSV